VEGFGVWVAPTAGWHLFKRSFDFRIFFAYLTCLLAFSYDGRPTTCDLRATTYERQPTTYDLRATSYDEQPTTYERRRTTYDQRLTTYDL